MLKKIFFLNLLILIGGTTGLCAQIGSQASVTLPGFFPGTTIGLFTVQNSPLSSWGAEFSIYSFQSGKKRMSFVFESIANGELQEGDLIDTPAGAGTFTSLGNQQIGNKSVFLLRRYFEPSDGAVFEFLGDAIQLSLGTGFAIANIKEVSRSNITGKYHHQNGVTEPGFWWIGAIGIAFRPMPYLAIKAEADTLKGIWGGIEIGLISF